MVRLWFQVNVDETNANAPSYHAKGREYSNDRFSFVGTNLLIMLLTRCFEILGQVPTAAAGPLS